MMVTNNKYELGDKVYLITDEEQKQWIVIEMVFALDGGMYYRLKSGTMSYEAYEKEMSETKNVLI